MFVFYPAWVLMLQTHLNTFAFWAGLTTQPNQSDQWSVIYYLTVKTQTWFIMYSVSECRINISTVCIQQLCHSFGNVQWNHKEKHQATKKTTTQTEAPTANCVLLHFPHPWTISITPFTGSSHLQPSRCCYYNMKDIQVHCDNINQGWHRNTHTW